MGSVRQEQIDGPKSAVDCRECEIRAGRSGSRGVLSRYALFLGFAASIVLLSIGYGAVSWRVRATAPRTVRLAEELLRRRDYAGARNTLKWLLWFDPGEQQAILIAGVSLNAERRFPEAIDVLGGIAEDGRHFEQGGIALAASLILDGQLERAENVLKRVLARFPASRDGLDRLVRLYLQELRIRDGIAMLESRWRRYPDDLSVLPDLLELTVEASSPSEHLDFLEAADKQHPRQFSVLLGLARACQRVGSTLEARQRLEAAVAVAPQTSDTHLSAAECFLDLNELGLAQSHLDLAASISASTVEGEARYWYVRCALAERSGNAEDAFADLQKALELRPNDESYLLMQATLLRRLSRAEEAAEAALRAGRVAAVRQQLSFLSDKLDRNRPESSICRAIADQLDSIGETGQAAGWRQIGLNAEQLSRPGAAALPVPGQHDAPGARLP